VVSTGGHDRRAFFRELLRGATRAASEVESFRRAADDAVRRVGGPDEEDDPSAWLTALPAKPTLRLAHFNLALLAEERGDVRAAEREYLEELKQHPENYKSAFNLSRLYEQAGDLQGQIDALKQSILSNPRFPEGHFFLAKAYLDSESNLDEAVRLALKGLELAPKSEYAPLGHYVLADVYNRQGRPREGAQELARGRSLERKLKVKS